MPIALPRSGIRDSAVLSASRNIVNTPFPLTSPPSRKTRHTSPSATPAPGLQSRPFFPAFGTCGRQNRTFGFAPGTPGNATGNFPPRCRTSKTARRTCRCRFPASRTSPRNYPAQFRTSQTASGNPGDHFCTSGNVHRNFRAQFWTWRKRKGNSGALSRTCRNQSKPPIFPVFSQRNAKVTSPPFSSLSQTAAGPASPPLPPTRPCAPRPSGSWSIRRQSTIRVRGLGKAIYSSSK